jgi:hypothetical protein
VRQNYKPLAGLSSVLCFLLKALIAVQFFSAASDIWTHFSLKSSIADLKSAQEELASVINDSRELVEQSRALDEEIEKGLAELESATKDAKNLLDPTATASTQADRNNAARNELQEATTDTSDDLVSEAPSEILADALREAEQPIPAAEGDSASEWWFLLDLYSGLFLFFAYLVLYIITGVLFLKWVYRANRNLRAFSGVEMKYGPAWAVWSYFVPIACFFVPPAVMAEIWAVSHRAKSGGLVGLWWLFVVVSALASEVSWKAFVSAFRQPNKLEAFTSDRIFLLSLGQSLLELVVTVLTLMLVARVTAAYSRNIVENLAGEPSVG